MNALNTNFEYKMWKRLKTLLVLSCLFTMCKTTLAQSPEGTLVDLNIDISYARGEVVEISEEGTEDFFGIDRIFQNAKIKIVSGPNSEQIISTSKGDMDIATEKQKMKVGDTVIISQKKSVDFTQNQIIDKYRVPAILIILSIFLVVTVIIGGKQGSFAILGLAFSILVISQFIIPQVLEGKNPLIISLIGSGFIATISLYLSHGLSKRTSIALLSMLIILVLAFGFSSLFVQWANLFGLGNEAAFYLQINNVEKLDLQGLLLGGIVIGTIGVLDDVTTTQVATIDELRKANNKLSRAELFKSGMSVGKEHIASLINTLALAYTGSSLPLFLLFHLDNDKPLWLILNSEFIAEEIVRTISGSLALILAVPLSTYLAAYVFTKKK